MACPSSGLQYGRCLHGAVTGHINRQQHSQWAARRSLQQLQLPSASSSRIDWADRLPPAQRALLLNGVTSSDDTWQTYGVQNNLSLD
mmetsp:Transcript_71352/g.141469  ORF Transcript_71352/g.141469 Transcript_71352/m.141469 type:complete len:87 (+) Transcript_71352:216-476(+)|eukprot:CAMPEP_0174716502 /NCGR_PEP_ID=MMETSP1094-20130205/24291_1 /TAXON_ID=156173 /ORGANISM="Chrysochromulina brevifilum, Strain UTEX LB 985" /LENGTH=86 /DNA_ID=CAMNT_0015916271 /DNA_START=216 /DNA_END=476 /DNA_ORIENTATION=-